MSTKPTELLKVSGKSDPQKVASAIAHSVYEGKDVVVRSIGAGAVNQAVKAVCIARGFTAARGFDLAIRPGFETVAMTDGSDMSAIVFNIVVS